MELVCSMEDKGWYRIFLPTEVKLKLCFWAISHSNWEMIWIQPTTGSLWHNAVFLWHFRVRDVILGIYGNFGQRGGVMQKPSPEFCLFVWDLRRESSCAKMSSLEAVTFPVVVANSRQRVNLGRNKSHTGEFTFRGKIELGRFLPNLLLLRVKIYRKEWGTLISKSALWLSVWGCIQHKQS